MIVFWSVVVEVFAIGRVPLTEVPLYRDCIKSRRDKIGITRHIMMHQVLYIVQLPNEEGDIHII